MSKQGQYNFKGINSQAWAAMSLFLQNIIYQKDFNYIIFEGKKLEDFCLVFFDGKKIICESKASHINFCEIKGILDKIINHQQLNSIDEILIICESIDDQAKSIIEHFKYYDETYKNKLLGKPHNFTKQHLEFFPQVKFWEIKQEFTKKTVESLIANIIKVWIPDYELSDIVRNFMITEVYFGSQKGQILTKTDFIQKINDRKIQIVRDSNYMLEQGSMEKRLKNILNSLKQNNTNKFPSKSISSLTDRPGEFHYIMQKIKEDKYDIDLQKWGSLWDAASKSFYSFELFDIFEQSQVSKKYKNNPKYILEFCSDLLSKNYMLVRDDFIASEIIKLCEKYLKESDRWNNTIFNIIKLLFLPDIKSYFYIQQRDISQEHERQQVAELLKQSYLNSSKKLQNEIIDYIFDNFNLIEDEGDLWSHAPTAIYGIVREHGFNDIEDKINVYTKYFIKQFSEYYKKYNKRKTLFKGWELMGSGIGQSGNRFYISDRHFVNSVLIPMIKNYYEKDSEKCWQYITKKCISRKIDDVNTKDNKPDFLNRACIPILLQEYISGKHSDEAHDIICDFITMRRGIPWKNDLIFQSICNDNALSDDKKWNLVEYSLKTFNDLPINVFVEQIVTNLAINGNKKAINELIKWSKNPGYIKKQIFHNFLVSSNIDKLLRNKTTFSYGVLIFENYIKQDLFINQKDDFDTYDLAKNLSFIIEQNTQKGIDILQDIYKSNPLSINQQILIYNSMLNLPDSNPKIVKDVFDTFLKPILLKFKDNKAIEKKISNAHSRDEIVQYAEKLARLNYYDDALWIIKIFINDSDPITSNKKGDFNYHQNLIDGKDEIVITTVRGWCAHALTKFALLPARNYLDQSIELLNKLTEDENLYVRHEACIPLTQFVQNRRTVMPDNDKELFMSIKSAEKIEDIVFSMLRDKNNFKAPALVKRIVMVFSYMRGISEKQAKEFIDTLLQYGTKESIEEATPLFLYFSYFRKNDFKKPIFKFVFQNKWKEITNFNDTYFKQKLDNLLVKGDKDIRQKFAWQFWRLPTENKANKSLWKISISGLSHIADGDYDHQIFDDIYLFIKDNFDHHPNECFALWKKCIIKERKAIELFTKIQQTDKLQWWPFGYNGEILIKVAKYNGNVEFLKWLKILTEYPGNIIAVNDLKNVMEYLVTLKESSISNIFDNLIQNINPKFIDDKKRWQINMKKLKKNRNEK